MRRVLALVALSACAAGPEEPAGRLPSAARDHAAQTVAEGSRTFGRALDESVPMTELSAILGAPERYRDRVVRTEGEIAQVCQRMGCWMELRAARGGGAVRVPMAGHSFFLPRDVAGRRATIEGRVALRTLSAGEREHLESEGATATASALAIHATGVVVR